MPGTQIQRFKKTLRDAMGKQTPTNTDDIHKKRKSIALWQSNYKDYCLKTTRNHRFINLSQ